MNNGGCRFARSFLNLILIGFAEVEPYSFYAQSTTYNHLGIYRIVGRASEPAGFGRK